jgi:four helix bundle protein
MRIERFEDLKMWQCAIELGILMNNEFRNSKNYALKDQMLRAVLSISNNIAEGFDAGSPRLFLRYLRISAGSCSEVRSMIHFALRSEDLSKEIGLNLLQQSENISRMIKAMILKQRPIAANQKKS